MSEKKLVKKGEMQALTQLVFQRVQGNLIGADEIAGVLSGAGYDFTTEDVSALLASVRSAQKQKLTKLTEDVANSVPLKATLDDVDIRLKELGYVLTGDQLQLFTARVKTHLRRVTTSNTAELAELVSSEVKTHSITTEQVSEVLQNAGYTFTLAAANRVRKVAKDLRQQKLVDLTRLVVPLLPLNPGRKVVEAKLKQLGHDLTDHQVKIVYKRLKSFPNLFDELPQIKTERAGAAFLGIHSKFDYLIVKEIAAATGITEKEALSLALRVFVQAYSIHGIPLEVLIRKGLSAGDLQISPHLETLRGLDFRAYLRSQK